NIVFGPDKNLGSWVMERTSRKMDLWRGTCYVHVEFTARSINRIREEYPDAPVVAHPECTYAVRMLADEVCSTEKMVTFCKESPAPKIIVVTEAGLLHRLRKEIPHKTFIPGPTDNCFCGECRFMKMNTLEKAYDALLHMEPEITLPESLRKRAEIPILRLVGLSKSSFRSIPRTRRKVHHGDSQTGTKESYERIRRRTSGPATRRWDYRSAFRFADGLV